MQTDLGFFDHDDAPGRTPEELGDDGQYFERIFITEPIMEGDRCVGAAGFSVRENKFYIFKANSFSVYHALVHLNLLFAIVVLFVILLGAHCIQFTTRV